MSVMEAECVYKGAVFVGTLEITGAGTDETIHVHYNGTCIAAKATGLEASIVAPTLLRELVMGQAKPVVRKRAPGRF